MTSANPLRGLLFIGDPHISSVAPGRRRDDNYTMTICDKLAQASRIATAEGLGVVFTGDLFHKAQEAKDTYMLTSLIRVIRTFPLVAGYHAWTLSGNHDLKETELSDDANLAILVEAGLVGLLSPTATEVAIGDGRVALYGVSYGKQIPAKVKKSKADLGVLVTHHALEFPGIKYPGVETLHEVAGIAMAVNGHQHMTADAPVTCGCTTWWNPGNISRLSVDTLSHRPAVWEWRPETPSVLLPHYLNVMAEPFDKSGRHVEALEGAPHGTLFAELLSAEGSDSARTSEGDLLKADLLDTFALLATSEDVRALALSLHAEACAS